MSTLDTEAPDELEDEQDEQPASDWDAARQVLGDYEDAAGYYSQWHQLIDDEVSFVLDQEQHETDLGHTLDPDSIQAKDLSLLSACRRKWSQIKSAPIQLSCWPTDQQQDPFAAERAKWAIERELYSKRKLFQRKRGRAILGAVVGRLWYLHAEWDEDLQEITYNTLKPGEVFKCPGFADMHDPQCPWVIIEKTLTVTAARALARRRGVDEETVRSIVADSDSIGTSGQSSRGTSPGLTRLDQTNPEGSPSAGLKNTVKLLVAMYREDPERAEIESTLEAPEELPPDQHFMRCWTCGYETQDHPVDATNGELPVVGEACPQCAAEQMQQAQQGMAPPGAQLPSLERVSTVEQVDRFPKYPDGRWIEVLKESRLVLWNREWPYQKPDGRTLRSYPLAEYKIYDDPRHEIPHSDVSWQWNQQALATYMLQWAVDQMRSSGRILMFPRGALVDSRGRAFTPTNRIDQVAWVKDAMLANAVKEFQPRGLPDGWSELYGAVSNSFRSNMGTGELGLGADQSKDIAVGTARAIIESGDIPVDDAIAMVREEDSMFFGIIADMIQCCWNAGRWVRFLGPEGQMAYEYFSGADLVDVDVEIQGDQTFRAVQTAELELYAQWFNMSPPQQRLVGRKMNLTPTEVFQFQQDQMQWMAAQPPTVGPDGQPVPVAGQPGQPGQPA